MAELLAPSAVNALASASDEARLLGHGHIGSEHILLGLMRERDSTAGRLLTHMGLGLDQLRAAVRLDVDQEAVDAGGVVTALDARVAIEIAFVEAGRLGRRSIASEHLLLALLRLSMGGAARVLDALGIDQPRTRARVLAEIRSSVAESTKSAAAVPAETAAGADDSNVAAAVASMTLGAEFAMRFARLEAARFRHNYVGTEHLLLGLIQVEDGAAAHVLARMGVTLVKIRAAVEFIIGRGEAGAAGEAGLTPRSKRAIVFAGDEMRLMNQERLDTEHLLLGLVREGEGIAAGVLESLGCRLERVRQTVHEYLGNASLPRPASSDEFLPAGDVLGRQVPPVVRLTPLSFASVSFLLDLLGSGRTDEEIAASFGVEASAIATRLGLLYAELGVDDRIATLIARLRDLAAARRGAGTDGDKTGQLTDTDPPET